jgi:hypothetical protein
MPTALVTGATAGIGAAFARRLAVEYHDLVLVARDAARLAALAKELHAAHGTKVDVLAADLATDEGCAVVEARLADARRPIDVLVNNAGIGLRNLFLGNTVEDEERMLRINVRAVMRLTHAVLPVMVARGRGDVVNVSSVAGFGPVSPGSTYSATKAWVTNFSESLHVAVRSKGVRVVALCPGYVRTEFHERAGISTHGINDRLWLNADSVARAALADLRRGRAVSTPSVQYKVFGGLVRHLPRPLFFRVISGAARRVRAPLD